MAEEGQPPSPAAALEPPKFKDGQRVELTGLQGAPERNGTFGRIMGWNAERERFEVHLEADDALLRVKPGKPSVILTYMLLLLLT